MEFLLENTQFGLTEDDFDEGALERAVTATKQATWEISRDARDLVDAYHAVCKKLLRGKRYGLTHYLYIPTVEKALTPKQDRERPRWSPLIVSYGGWMVIFQAYKDEELALQHMVEELRPSYRERDRILRRAVLGR